MEEKIEAVQRMQDYIAEHLSETITLTALSSVSYYSPWYSYRLFLQHTNMTPADYIRRLRLSKSAIKLRDESCKIIDTALELGFGSVDGYQRAFFREFGCNPREYAKSPVPLYLFTPYGVKYRALRKEKQMETVKSVFVAIEDVQTAISKYDPAVIGAQWDSSNPRIQLEPVGTRGYIELLPIK